MFDKLLFFLHNFIDMNRKNEKTLSVSEQYNVAKAKKIAIIFILLALVFLFFVVSVFVGSDTLIYRLLFNLTENAIRYNRPNGTVRISIAEEETQIVVRVADSGCGIPEEYRRSIFQPFFRVDKSRSRAYGGVGLGLSLVWEIARLHGGEVLVEKSTEEGTTMAVRFPC